eukprot:16838-Heterococcus_DN1.PRE.1
MATILRTAGPNVHIQLGLNNKSPNDMDSREAQPFLSSSCSSDFSASTCQGCQMRSKPYLFAHMCVCAVLPSATEPSRIVLQHYCSTTSVTLLLLLGTSGTQRKAELLRTTTAVLQHYYQCVLLVLGVSISRKHTAAVLTVYCAHILAQRLRNGLCRKFMPARTSYDHVCVSAYNWGDDKSGGYKAFEEVFTFAYKNMAEATDAPLGLCEGSTVGPGGDKGDWYKAALETLMKLPR